MIVIYILAGLIGAICLAFVFLLICALLVDPTKTYDRNSRFYRRLLNVCTAIAVPLMRIRVHVEGMEKIPRGTRKILFVGNHRSNFDPIVTWYALRDWDIAFLSKEENFRIPIFGRVIRKCCFLPIDRTDPRKAMTTIVRAAHLLENGEVSIAVYPEGTRSKTCELLPFHNGVFKIAQRAQAQVVVLAVSGTERIFKNFPLHRTDVTLSVVDVIDAQTAAQEKTAQLGERVREKLARQLGESAAV